MTPWQVLVDMIEEQEVEMVFGLGDNYINMLAGEKSDMLAVNVRHESSAPFMAMAYSRLSGNVGVCSGSQGPGTANLIPGTLEAHSGHTPLVMPCHSSPLSTSGRGEFQECDQVGMMEPVTKWSARVTDSGRLPWYVQRAFRNAIAGSPGPVYLDLPDDVMGEGPLRTESRDNGEELSTPGDHDKATRSRMQADEKSVQKTLEMLIEADRPLVIFGNGAVFSRAFAAAEKLIDDLKLPFLTTPGGRGLIPESHPLALGVSGRYRTEPARIYQESADLIFTVGSSNEAFQTGGWQHMPAEADYIQLDIKPEAIGRSWQPDHHLIGDARTVMEQLLDMFEARKKNRSERIAKMEEDRKAVAAEIREEKEKFFDQVQQEKAALSRPLLARQILPHASEIFGQEAILVNENGSQDIWSYFYPYFQVESRLGCIPVAEQTCMGIGVVGAIAASLTEPDRPVLCVAGDGAFQMYMQEMATAVQYEAGCTWLVLNNSGLGWIRAKQQRAGFSQKSTEFTTQPEMARVAENFGCLGLQVEEPDELRPALRSALSANKRGQPALIDCRLEYEPDMSHLDDGKWWQV